MYPAASLPTTWLHADPMFSGFTPATGIPAQAGPKNASLCIIPECPRSKYVDPSSGATHDYCGKTHAEEGKKRGISAPLGMSGKSEVKRYLYTIVL